MPASPQAATVCFTGSFTLAFKKYLKMHAKDETRLSQTKSHSLPCALRMMWQNDDEPIESRTTFQTYIHTHSNIFSFY